MVTESVVAGSLSRILPSSHVWFPFPPLTSIFHRQNLSKPRTRYFYHNTSVYKLSWEFFAAICRHRLFLLAQMASRDAQLSSFALLRPANLEAQSAFSDLAEVIISNAVPENGELSHAAKFMFIEPANPAPTSRSSKGYGSVGFENSKSENAERDTLTEVETDSGDNSTEIPQSKYHGHYIFSFNVSPL